MVKVLFSFSFVLRYIVSGVCLFVYYFCFLSVYFGCAGSVGIFWRAGSYIFCAYGLRCVECRAGTILIGHILGAEGGTVQIFPSLWFCCSGYGTVEMVRGGGLSFSRFLQFAVSSLGGWMSVVGFLCYTIRFSLVDL